MVQLGANTYLPTHFIIGEGIWNCTLEGMVKSSDLGEYFRRVHIACVIAIPSTPEHDEDTAQTAQRTMGRKHILFPSRNIVEAVYPNRDRDL
jgi:hypothetical protein